MDEQLRAAYERLDGALEPPGDAVALVTAHLTARRRRRRANLSVAGAAAAVVALTGIAVGVGGDDGRAPDAPVASGTGDVPTPAPTSEPTPEPTRQPWTPEEPPASSARTDDLACPTAERRLGVVANPEDYSLGQHYGPGTVRPWLLPEAFERFYRIDPDQVVARLVTQRGDIYAELGLISIRNQWRVIALAACASRFTLADSTATQPLLAVPENQCWVGTLEHLGRSWDLRDEDQFGFGGLGPDGFLGVGSATASADGARLDYVDVSGAELTFVPADSPGTEANQGRCD